MTERGNKGGREGGTEGEEDAHTQIYYIIFISSLAYIATAHDHLTCIDFSTNQRFINFHIHLSDFCAIKHCCL